MRVTYTAEDGTTFNTEEACIAYESMQDIIRHIAGPFTGDREWIDAEEHFGFQNGFITILGSGFSAKELMEYRQSILRLAEVLLIRKPKIALGLHQ